jgi:hypothetical protein
MEPPPLVRSKLWINGANWRFIRFALRPPGPAYRLFAQD